MFENQRLPTLDTEICFDERYNYIAHFFFEKKLVPNHVLQKTTTLSSNSIRASSLTQDVVRRLRACSEMVLIIKIRRFCLFLSKN